MKNYRITVNGTAYDLAVEELGAGSAPVAAPVTAPVAAAVVSEETAEPMYVPCVQSND